MGLLLHKKKDKELYNVYSTIIDDYLYKWSDKKVIAAHVYSRFQKEAREKAKSFMQEIDEEV